METTSRKDAVNIVEMTTKDFKYYIHLVDKTVAGFERIDSSFKRSSTMGKNSIACYKKKKKIIGERKSQSMQQSSLPYFKKCPQPPGPSATTILISQHPSTSR